MALQTPEHTTKDDNGDGFDGFLKFCKSDRENLAPDIEALPGRCAFRDIFRHNEICFFNNKLIGYLK